MAITDSVSIGSVQPALDWSYNAVLNGLPGSKSVYELADGFSRGNRDIFSQIEDLIRWQAIKCAITGAVTGLGGFASLPVTLPPAMVSQWYIHLRMIAAIAYMNKYDLHDDRVRTLCFVCLCGNKALPVIKEAGVELGIRIIENVTMTSSTALLQTVCRKISMRGLVSRSAGKLIPFAGAFVGATVDGGYTFAVGKSAKVIFEK